MATPKFTARDIAHIRRTGLELIGQQIDETYDGPETIMTSLGYVDVWPEGDDDASVTMHGVNYSLEELERASKRRAAKNGSSESLTAAEHAALARFAAEHGRSWKSKILRMRANSSAFPMNYPVACRACNRIGPSGIKSLRLAAPNGRSRLKRTKLACARRARATRKGSSKAASRLATHCPKRRKGGK